MARKKSNSSKGLPLIIFVLIFALIAFGLFFISSNSFKPVDLKSSDTQNFIVKKGQSVDSIGQELHQSGLVKSPISFKIMVSKLGLSRNIQAGGFKLSPAQTTQEIAQSLTKGTTDIWVTILEGWRREEIAAELTKTFNQNDIVFDEDEFLRLTEGREGYLFPDPYLMPLSTTEQSMAAMLSSTFDSKFSDQLQAGAQKSGRSIEDIVIMASLIEREAKTDESRKMISGILWKRLDNDWPLQVDATLQYAKGYNSLEDTWWTPPTAAEKQVDSPYNTYQHPGLPLGPIASPSLSSLEAAVYPTSSAYWYYLTDLEGGMHYGETLEDHNQNIANYLR